MILKRIIILLFVIVFNLCATRYSSLDSLNLSGTTTNGYDLFNGTISLDKKFNNSKFILQGNSKTTIYENDKKNSNLINSEYDYYFSHFGIGFKSYGNFWYDETITLPSANNLYFMPLITLNYFPINLKSGIGYINRKNDDITNDGVKYYFKSSYDENKNVSSILTIPSLLSDNEKWKLDNSFEGDNLDSLFNYKYNIQINYQVIFPETGLDLLILTTFDEGRYYYSTSNNNQSRNESTNYDIKTTLGYRFKNTLLNSVGFNIIKTGKKGFTGNDLSKKNKIIKLKLSDNFFYSRNNFEIISRVSFQNGGDNFFYKDNNDNYENYAYNFNIEPKYQIKKHLFKLSSGYYKYSFISQNDDNGEDHDIQSMNIAPYYQYGRSEDNLILKQELKFDFYHLVNVSPEKSSGNLKEKTIQSISNIILSPQDNLRNSFCLDFRTTYNIYDYEKSSDYITSYLVKKWTLKDSIEYEILPKFTQGTFFNFTFEEFSFFDSKKFIEDPQTFQKKYLTGLYFIIKKEINLWGYKKNIEWRSEYFYFEIDNFKYDTLESNNYLLEQVNSYHGVKSILGIKSKDLNIYFSIKYRVYGRNIQTGFQEFNFKLSYYL